MSALAAYFALLLLASCASRAGTERDGPHLDVRIEGPILIPAGSPGWTSAPVRPARPFNEVLPSWNVVVPKNAGIRVRISLRRDETDSPWLDIGDYGVIPKLQRRTKFDAGRVDIDIFRSEQHFDSVRVQVLCYGQGSAVARLERLQLCFSDTTRPFEIAAPTDLRPIPRIPFPLIRQGEAPKAIRSRVCSPSSVAMVMAASGRAVPLAQLCAEIHDPTHRIYGVWNRAVQTAFSHGLPGYLTRIASWDRALRYLRAGQPLVISIAAAKGQLRNAPYSETTGHLIVLAGLSKDGRCIVADPGAGRDEAVERLYYREDLERAWMKRGGYCYVIGS